MSRSFYAHPQATCDRARRLCQVYPQKVVAELVGMTPACLSRMKKRGFIAGQGKPLRPMPSDFAIQAARMTARALSQHYRASEAIVARWRAQAGELSRRGRGRGSFKALPLPGREQIEEAIAGGRTFAEIAAALGVCRQTLRRWRRAYCLMIWFVIWEEAIWMCLLSPAEQETYFAKFNEGALLRGSLEAQANFLSKAMGQAPFMYADEARDYLNLNKIAGGDALPRQGTTAATIAQEAKPDAS